MIYFRKLGKKIIKNIIVYTLLLTAKIINSIF